MHADRSAMDRMSRQDFAAFYRETAPALRGYLARVTANPDLADDLLQETYIRLINAAPVHETQRKGYLYRTATNLALDHFRSLRRERAGLALWKRWQPVAVTRHPETGVEGVFKMLNIRERALLWLAYVEQATHAEIAAALGCREKSVRVLLFRTRRKMEGLLRSHNIVKGGQP